MPLCHQAFGQQLFGVSSTSAVLCTAGNVMPCPPPFHLNALIQALEEAGAFAVLLECLPPLVAAAVTQELSIPTIGIGAGAHCSGQVIMLQRCSMYAITMQ